MPPPRRSGSGRFERWIDLKEFDGSLRYRNVTDANQVNEFSQAQQRGVIDGKFKFDRQGRYGIGFHGSSGKTFNWAYADFMGGGNAQALALEGAKAKPSQLSALGYGKLVEPGTYAAMKNSGGWSFYVRRLFLDVEPVEGVQAQYGSIDLNRGAGSEITTYDNDGYLDGGRISIKRPKNLFFDEASVTYGYLGDLYTPNFFARGQRLAHSNYHQFLIRKAVKNRVDASFDYTWQDKANTFREAANVKLPELKIVDSVRLEAYQRINQIRYRELKLYRDVGNGFGITATKKIKRVSLDVGVADVDENSIVMTQLILSAIYGLSLNGDSYGIGKRGFVRPTVKLTPYLDASGFYTQQWGTIVNPNITVWNKQAFNVGLNLDMKKLLFPEHGK